MASSASGGLDSSESSSEARRTYFWCHQCNARTTNRPGSEEYTCGLCGSGFVEEITEETEPAADDDDDYLDDDDLDDPAHQMGLDPIFQQFFSAAVQSSQPRAAAGGGRAGPTWTSRRRRIRGQGPQVVVGTGDQFLQMLLSNLTGVQFAAGGGGGGFVPVMPLYGNPGDYAWGRGGLDAVVTSLLNQIDGAGPAPMQTDSISQIPKIKISSSQVDAKLQCSVCWDDFALGEEVRKLVCEHIFHEGCIVPWLQLHATCPVCRKTQQPEEQEARIGFADGNSPSAADILSPLFVGASSGAQSGGATTSTAGTSGGSSSGGPSTAAAPEAASSFGNTISTVFNQFFGIPSPSSPSASSSSATSTASSSSSASTSSGGGPTPSSTSSQSTSSNRRSTNNNPPKNESFKDMDLE